VKLPTIKCETCQRTIAKAIESVKGVTRADVDLTGKVATVEFMSGLANLKQIEVAVSNAGYDADDLKRDPEAYENLPTCCK
jgi:copper chaperone CopZ